MNRKNPRGRPARSRRRLEEADPWLASRTPDYRWYHGTKVGRLRRILADRPDDALESELYTTREVAVAIGSTQKVIRWLGDIGLLKFTTRPGPKPRKRFYVVSAIREYRDRCVCIPDSSALRSQKIVAMPAFYTGKAVTKKQAAAELRITVSGVNYYLAKKILERAPGSKRRTLITKASLASLAWKRINTVNTEYEIARKKLQRVQEKRKKICGS